MRDAKHLLNGTGVPVVTVVPVIVCRRMPVARNATLWSRSIPARTRRRWWRAAFCWRVNSTAKLSACCRSVMWLRPLKSPSILNPHLFLIYLYLVSAHLELTYFPPLPIWKLPEFISTTVCQACVSESSEPSLSLQLSLAQIHLSQGQVKDACQLLRQLGPDTYQPAIVRTSPISIGVWRKLCINLELCSLVTDVNRVCFPGVASSQPLHERVRQWGRLRVLLWRHFLVREESGEWIKLFRLPSRDIPSLFGHRWEIGDLYLPYLCYYLLNN